MAKDCQLQSSAKLEHCDGAHHNLDLYIKTEPSTAPTPATTPEPSLDTPGYEHVYQGCVNGANLVKYTDKSVMECARLCDARDDCHAFEYGVAHGGSGSYKAKDCQLQSSAKLENCDGAHHNLDLYIKTEPSTAPTPATTPGPSLDTPGYMHVYQGCVNGANLVKYTGKSVMECARLCDARDDCHAFEYGVAHGGSGSYKAKDCQLQSSAKLENCDGAH